MCSLHLSVKKHERTNLEVKRVIIQDFFANYLEIVSWGPDYKKMLLS